ncbi:hypothetical protein [Metamycoplasma alkalescens]|uniref:Uncharacterized protein n=2 Tax=Metamycoplasma alkalescens TaxID=45363 RepID=A0A318UI46_9BACT|nr:hypothetical protein [Metamycoplasma alkalescens]PYF42189.1 hypothetical protein BCF88_1162 [Metamycoplasma alkalescens]
MQSLKQDKKLEIKGIKKSRNQPCIYLAKVTSSEYIGYVTIKFKIKIELLQRPHISELIENPYLSFLPFEIDLKGNEKSPEKILERLNEETNKIIDFIVVNIVVNTQLKFKNNYDSKLISTLRKTLKIKDIKNNGDIYSAKVISSKHEGDIEVKFKVKINKNDPTTFKKFESLKEYIKKTNLVTIPIMIQKNQEQNEDKIFASINRSIYVIILRIINTNNLAGSKSSWLHNKDLLDFVEELDVKDIRKIEDTKYGAKIISNKYKGEEVEVKFDIDILNGKNYKPVNEILKETNLEKPIEIEIEDSKEELEEKIIDSLYFEKDQFILKLLESNSEEVGKEMGFVYALYFAAFSRIKNIKKDGDKYTAKISYLDSKEITITFAVKIKTK